jgi:methylenetetrahydrofolate reductase (NADPH)
MKVIDIINSKRQFPSLEFVPPLKGTDIRKLYANIERLMEFKPPFINVTCHTDEVKYFENPDGSIARKTITKRPGTVAIAAAIMKRFDVEVVPHIICAGMNKWQIENELLDLNFLEINNVMALRGEAPGGMKRFEAARDGYKYASQLVEQIENLNRGKYLDEGLTDPVPTNFCVGVGGYPGKHCEAPNIETDIRNLKKKVDAGADFVITQMFFDNDSYFNYVSLCRKEGITVPIIPGLKPLSSVRQLAMIPKSFSIDIPETLGLRDARMQH